jgi:hypothetical protein
MAKKTVSVTSVTPKSKVKASTEKEKASTRKTVAAIASLTPVGRVAKTATTAVKAAKVAKAASAKRIPATYTKTPQAKPIKVVKKTTPPIYRHAETDAILEQQWAKSVKAAEKMGMDIKKMKITIDGRTIDYKGIR